MSGNRIRYRVRLARPRAHLFAVELLIPRPAATGQCVSLPAWIPGSYMIRDFARNIVSLCAYEGDQALPLGKQDKQTWVLGRAFGPVRLVYEVYAWDLSVRAAHFDQTHAYFNGTSLFLRVHGAEELPCIVEVAPPDDDACDAWRVATAMRSGETDASGFGSYSAENYQDLIDHPFEIGRFNRSGFTVGTVPHELVLYGRQHADMARLARDLSRICEQQRALFGKLPLDRYLFLAMAVGEGYGGLEHRYSCSLLCSRDDLPWPGKAAVSEGYRRFLGLCSHEYFHLWNVKRIRPQVLADADLDREAHTRLLWAFEGITSYYDDLFLVRSGCIDERSYLELLAHTITRVMQCAGRHRQSLAESSFDAWTRFYKQDENAPNAIVSYYTKGALVALALDLTLRVETAGDRSLDHIMRALWERYGKTGVGVAEQGVEELVQQASGLDLRDFFARLVHDTADPPLAALFDTLGIEYRLRPAKGAKDLGALVDDFPPEQAPPFLGVRIDPADPAPRLSVVMDGGPAQLAGLSAGDILVAMDGLRVTGGNLEQRLAALEVDRVVEIHAFRRDELMIFPVRPAAAPADTCELRLRPHCSPEQLARRRAWLGSLV